MAFKADFLNTIYVDIGDNSPDQENSDAEAQKGMKGKNYISQSLIVERLGN